MELADLEKAKIVPEPVNITHMTLRSVYGVSVDFTEKSDDAPGTFEIHFPVNEKDDWLEFLVYCANQIESGSAIGKTEFLPEFSEETVLVGMNPFWYDQFGAKHNIIFTTPES